MSTSQFKAIDEAQKIFVVMEMMPKDIKREFLTFDEIMEKLEIIISEIMADDGPPVVATFGASATMATRS